MNLQTTADIKQNLYPSDVGDWEEFPELLPLIVCVDVNQINSHTFLQAPYLF